MKVLKGNQHSFLFRSFGWKGGRYCSLALLLCFDLTAPESLLTEQQLWEGAMAELGSGQALDEGYPKPQAEVLLAGACHAPRGQRIQAARVGLHLGDIHKILAVFGQRYWLRNSGMPDRISEPLQFERLPLTWENAFGGPGNALNPKGRGLAPVLDEEGQERLPLPTVELPEQLVGLQSDRPPPACCLPLELTHPQRRRYQGTYDAKWQRTRHPDLPDDCHPLFFNTAPEDQQLRERFFQGGEALLLENLHPDYPELHASLPRVRGRCLVARVPRQGPQGAEQVFQDLQLNLDTVWLLPSVLRGILVFRGVCETGDDTASDIQDVYLAHEPLDQAPRPMGFYKAERLKALQRKVTVDQAPLQRAQAKVDAALQQLRALPKDLEAMRARTLGQGPRLPRTPAELQAGAMAQLATRLKGLQALEGLSATLQAKVGGPIPPDLPQTFAQLRKGLAGMQQRLGGLAAKSAQEAKQRAENLQAVRKDLGAKLRERLSPEQLARAGIDPDKFPPDFPTTPQDPWQEQGLAFAVACRKRLLGLDEAPQDPEGGRVLARLLSLGLSRATVKRHWLGWNPVAREYLPQAWGLPATEALLALPPGLVLPRFLGARLTELRIRALPPSGGVAGRDQDFLVPGAVAEPLFVPALTALGEAAPLLLVGDELELLLLEQEVGDLCSLLVLPGPEVTPGGEAVAALKASCRVLLVLGEQSARDFDPTAWQGVAQGLGPLVLPKGQRPSEARRLGVALRPWVLAALPPDLAAQGADGVQLPPKDGPPGKDAVAKPHIALPDLRGFAANLRQELGQGIKARVPDMTGRKAELEALAAAELRNLGRDPAALLGPAATAGLRPPGAMGQEVARVLLEHATGLGQGAAAARAAATLRDRAAEAQALGARLQGVSAEAANLRSGAKGKLAGLAAGDKPPRLAEALREQGLDPERLRPLTREEVIQRHGAGQSLAYCDLSGLDLAGLPLSGARLGQSLCRKTNFKGCDLSGADLAQAQLTEADFSGADLREASFVKALCAKARFGGAGLRRADFSRADLSEADCTGADLGGALLDMALLRKTLLVKADLTGCRARLAVLNEADATGADFSRAELRNCMLQKVLLDQADFTGATLGLTMCSGVLGEGVRFTHGRLSELRMSGGTRLPGADFSGADLRKAYFRETSLRGAVFRGAVLERAMFDGCSLLLADFLGVNARWCRFENSDLEGATLRGSNLFQGSLRKSRLVQTDLRGSNLFSVDLTRAVFGETLLVGANLKRTLLWQRDDLLEEPR